MGAIGMLLLLVGSMVAAQIIRAFLTWKPRNQLSTHTRRERGRRTVVRNH